MASKHKRKFKWKSLRTKTKQKIAWVAIALFTVICVCIIAYVSQHSDSYNFEEEFDRYAKTVSENKNAIESFPDKYMTKFDESDICVCFGDAITGNMQSPEDYPTVMAEKLGMTVINAGYDGCRMSRHIAEEYDAFSMYRIADSIAMGDWSYQDQYVNMLPMEYATERLQTLKALDWNTVDVITIAYGSEDINAAVDIENENRASSNSVNGALRYSIEKIQKAYPHIKIIVVTPVYRYWESISADSDSKDFNGHSFIEWVDGMIEVAEEYHIPYVDLYRNSGFNTLNREYYYQTDGIHPNAKGLEVIGRQIAAAIWNYC